VLIPLTFALLNAVAADRLPVRPPQEVGMSAERLANIDRVVRRGLSAGGYPGAAVVVGRRGAAAFQRGYGRLGWTSGSPSVSPEETIYDLASLTKVVGTTTAAMILYDEGRLDLDAPVITYLPAFGGGAKDRVTVRQLLTHHSGLPAGKQLWRHALTREQAREIVLASELVCSPGNCYIYSDLGADVLGWVVESIAGTTLDQFLALRVFEPLGMVDTRFNPSHELQTRIAPTEVSPPRGYPLRGEVHDENAFALGGVAGHAGLFSTAADLAVFAEMMLNGGVYGDVRIVSDSAVARFTSRTSGTRALGWDTADGDGGSGEYLSSRAYGHTGFTGTSMWIDPDRDMFVILLTNRVHAARARRPGKVISDVRADLADAAALAVVEGVDEVPVMPASFRADRADGWNPAVRRSRSSRRSRSARARSATTKKRVVSTRTVSAKAKKPTTTRAKTTTKPRTSTAKSRNTTAKSRSTTAARRPATKPRTTTRSKSPARKG
jgi:CubicO group peptidase (beta-lactamase class C family)